MIGILEAGRPPKRLREEWGTYATMSRALVDRGQAFRSYAVDRGELPAAVEECGAYVVTGSKAGVYDDLPWLAPLFGFLRQARGRAKLVGICFGHQALAHAFGGRVIKSPKGWGLGLHRYEAPGMGLAGMAVPAFHQDQVVEAPVGAEVLASSAFTPFAALRYGEDAFGIQPHPEFSPAFSKALLEAQRTDWADHADGAIASLDAPADNAAVGAWIGRFIGA